MKLAAIKLGIKIGYRESGRTKIGARIDGDLMKPAAVAVTLVLTAMLVQVREPWPAAVTPDG